MSPDTITLIWLGGGAALALIELIVPGGVLGFMGLSAMLIAGARALGFFEGIASSFVAWLVLSGGLVLALKGVVDRFIGSEKSFGSTDEDVDAFGAKVEVLAEVTDDADTGRIRFRGTSWPARAVRGTLPPGVPARIVHRDNLVWIVEPYSALPPGEDS